MNSNDTLIKERWTRFHYEQRETIVTLLCESQYQSVGEETLFQSRHVIENYIEQDSDFRSTHVPHTPRASAPELIRRMCREARKVGIGPMSTVAGGLASLCLKGLLWAGAKEAIIDNGGDIALFVQEPVRVGIYGGITPIRELAFEVEPRDEPLGICTSSGVIGPSHSYGKAHAAVVVSSNLFLADAAATALGNRVLSSNDLETCFDFLEELPEIEGALVLLDDQVAMWGDLPSLVRSSVDEKLITKGEG